MEAARELAPEVGVATSCRSLGVARATFYRSREKTPEAVPDRTKPRSPRALSEPERGEVLSVLHEPELVDRSPAAVYAWLLDERQTYLCSIRTMYRILASNGEVRERRDQRRHPRHPVPRLVASRPNQVWTWDITKLLGPAKWTYFYLYVILDLFSRYVVGWLLAREESARLARELIAESCRRQGIVEDQLTVHADRGPSMTAKSLALLLADLGVTKSHSRPRVSNDNPYSEAQFKTLKYRPQFPPRFGSEQHGRAFCREFFPWYNQEHYHSSLGLLKPAMVHYGRAEEVLRARGEVLEAAYAAHPERFVRRPPRPAAPPGEVWINKPNSVLELEEVGH
jgi:putative transposase